MRGKWWGFPREIAMVHWMDELTVFVLVVKRVRKREKLMERLLERSTETSKV